MLKKERKDREFGLVNIRLDVDSSCISKCCWCWPNPLNSSVCVCVCSCVHNIVTQWKYTFWQQCSRCSNVSMFKVLFLLFFSSVSLYSLSCFLPFLVGITITVTMFRVYYLPIIKIHVHKIYVKHALISSDSLSHPIFVVSLSMIENRCWRLCHHSSSIRMSIDLPSLSSSSSASFLFVHIASCIDSFSYFRKKTNKRQPM